MKIHSTYWRHDKLILNLGDYITQFLIEAFGYEFVAYEKGDTSLVWIIGSLFDPHWFGKYAERPDKIIWGCGFSGNTALDPERVKQACDIRAVRGYKTRAYLNLPDTIPVGDPALLLPKFLPLEKQSSGEVLYIPHFESRDRLSAGVLDELGATSYTDIACTRQQFFDTIATINNADFVLTSSLHGAIISQAYQTPWALVVPESSAWNMPFKWADWFDYLGHEQLIKCPNISAAREWWKVNGCNGKVRDLQPLIDSFPHSSAV
jgi:hypothetical protein